MGISCRNLLNKIPYRFITLWILVMIVLTALYFKSPEIASMDLAIPTNQMVNAVVLIAMSKFSADPIVDNTIVSLRSTGKWAGDIFVVTDHPLCFADTVASRGVKIVEVPRLDSLSEIKSLKTKLFDFLPPSIQGILYIDVDITFKQNLDYFFRDLSDLIIRKRIALRPSALSLQSVPLELRKINASTPLLEAMYMESKSTFDFAAFPDALGHYIGFCSGCEKWHTGVMFFRRGAGISCLSAWRKILLSGKYETDQESLDEAERQGHCPHAYFLPPKHLLFAKDYLAMMLTSGHTFVHMTAAGRLETQDPFYRYIVVPRIRKQAHDSASPISDIPLGSTESKDCL